MYYQVSFFSDLRSNNDRTGFQPFARFFTYYVALFGVLGFSQGISSILMSSLRVKTCLHICHCLSGKQKFSPPRFLLSFNSGTICFSVICLISFNRNAFTGLYSAHAFVSDCALFIISRDCFSICSLIVLD